MKSTEQNKPVRFGMAITNDCLGMQPEDVATLFALVPARSASTRALRELPYVLLALMLVGSARLELHRTKDYERKIKNLRMKY
jgi:hypothetical protein